MNSFIDLMNCERIRLSIILDELADNESLKITDLGHNKETDNVWIAVEQFDDDNEYKVVLFVSEVKGEAYKVRYLKTDDETGKETIYEHYDDWYAKREDGFERWRKSLTPQEEQSILMDGYRKYLKTIE